MDGDDTPVSFLTRGGHREMRNGEGEVGVGLRALVVLRLAGKGEESRRLGRTPATNFSGLAAS